MHALKLSKPIGLPVWGFVPLWMALFFSPTLYLCLLCGVIALFESLKFPALPETLVAGLFYSAPLIPVLGLLGCGTLIWQSNLSQIAKICGILTTLVGMILQCGFWLFIIASLINAMIALP